MNTILLKSAVIGAMIATALGAGPAFAGTTSGNVPVSAVVQSSCSVTSSSAISFGTVTTSNLPVNAQGSISFTCTSTTPWFVTSNAGSNAVSGQARMVNGGSSLPYNIYSDSARTVSFPTAVGTLGSGNTGGTGNGVSQAVTIYGQVPTGNVIPAPGTYSDTLSLTVNY